MQHMVRHAWWLTCSPVACVPQTFPDSPLESPLPFPLGPFAPKERLMRCGVGKPKGRWCPLECKASLALLSKKTTAALTWRDSISLPVERDCRQKLGVPGQESIQLPLAFPSAPWLYFHSPFFLAVLRPLPSCCLLGGLITCPGTDLSLPFTCIQPCHPHSGPMRTGAGGEVVLWRRPLRDAGRAVSLEDPRLSASPACQAQSTRPPGVTCTLFQCDPLMLPPSLEPPKFMLCLWAFTNTDLSSGKAAVLFSLLACLDLLSSFTLHFQ